MGFKFGLGCMGCLIDFVRLDKTSYILHAELSRGRRNLEDYLGRPGSVRKTVH